MNRKCTIWIGDLDNQTDEDFLVQTFRILGEPLCGVKIIKKDSDSLFYGFLEFPDEETAQSVLHKYNGKPLPNAPAKRFKLNHANTNKDSASLVKDYSIFVGDLGPEVDDLALFDAFVSRYKTVKLAKVIYDSFGVSKGYGFVHFCNRSEYEASLIEMQNVHIGSKTIRVSTAQTKSSRTGSAPSSGEVSAPLSEEQQWQQQYPGYDYSSYYAAWQNYQNQTTAAYYNYDQRYGAYGAYPYSQYYADPNQAAATTATAASPQDTTQYSQTAYEAPEAAIEEHDVPLDIDQMNQEFMAKSEEFYTALDNSRWLPVENLDPPLVRIK